MSIFTGVIIEESLESSDVLTKLEILSTKVVPVVEAHQTPWLSQWTMHDVEIPEGAAALVAESISKLIISDQQGSWYADFKNDTHHYIVFRSRVFYVDRKSQPEYDEAKAYGISLGIPEHQVDFHPLVDNWEA